MPLPSTGSISMNQVNVELGKTETSNISLNDTAVRNLAKKPSGTISMSDLIGKSNALFETTITVGKNQIGVEYGYHNGTQLPVDFSGMATSPLVISDKTFTPLNL